MEDKSIISMLLARAEGAIEALVQRFEKQLYHTAMNILENREDALECVNDTWLALWSAIPPAQPDPLAPYVQRTGRNIALKRLRTNTAQRRNGSYDLSLDELAGCLPDDSADFTADTRAVGLAIDEFLSHQSQENRVIFLRRYWFGDSVRDIAQATGLRENAVSVRLSRIRDKLKDYLIKEGFYYET